MSEDWMLPNARPLPGPVASEVMQMTRAEREDVVLQGATAAHHAAGHEGAIYGCEKGCLVPITAAAAPKLGSGDAAAASSPIGGDLR